MSSGSFPDMLKLHFLVLIWGFAAVLGRLISIPAVEIVFYRTSLAVLGLYILLRLRKQPIKMPVADLWKVLGIGALIGAHWIFFFASARISTVSVCLAGMATTSLWTSIIEPVFHRRRIYKHEVILGLIILCGLYIIFHFEWVYWQGLLFAIISAFLAALFSVFNSIISPRHNHHIITYYEMIGACAITLIFFPIYHYGWSSLQLQLIGWDWMYLLILALVCTVYAYAHYVELMKRLTPYTINLTLNMEPLYGIILAVLIFGEKEKMHTGFYIGAIIILLSILIHPYISKKTGRKPNIPEMS